MSREIKFRAWIETGKFKYMNYSIEFCGGLINDIFATSGKEPLNIYHSKITYMQYTGLKDKNGKEIYEGDILEDKWGYRFPVFFEDGCYKTDSEDFEKVNERQINYHNLKVIGNIYENPELLEEKKS